MQKKLEHLPWAQLSEAQKEQVSTKLAKAFTSEAPGYMQKPGMKYTIDEQGQATGGYIDPYMLSNFFSI